MPSPLSGTQLGANSGIAMPATQELLGELMAGEAITMLNEQLNIAVNYSDNVSISLLTMISSEE